MLSYTTLIRGVSMARAQSKIGQLMYEQHLKQNQVAKLLGVTPQAVGRWVRGEAFPEAPCQRLFKRDLRQSEVPSAKN